MLIAGGRVVLERRWRGFHIFALCYSLLRLHLNNSQRCLHFFLDTFLDAGTGVWMWPWAPWSDCPRIPQIGGMEGAGYVSNLLVTMIFSCSGGVIFSKIFIEIFRICYHFCDILYFMVLGAVRMTEYEWGNY